MASKGFLNLEEDVKQAEKWLEEMADKESDNPGVASLFDYEVHHSFILQGEGLDIEEEEKSGKNEEMR
jgi:hypothetical protein